MWSEDVITDGLFVVTITKEQSDSTISPSSSNAGKAQTLHKRSQPSSNCLGMSTPQIRRSGSPLGGGCLVGGSCLAPVATGGLLLKPRAVATNASAAAAGRTLLSRPKSRPENIFILPSPDKSSSLTASVTDTAATPGIQAAVDSQQQQQGQGSREPRRVSTLSSNEVSLPSVSGGGNPARTSVCNQSNASSLSSISLASFMSRSSFVNTHPKVEKDRRNEEFQLVLPVDSHGGSSSKASCASKLSIGPSCNSGEGRVSISSMTPEFTALMRSYIPVVRHCENEKTIVISPGLSLNCNSADQESSPQEVGHRRPQESNLWEACPQRSGYEQIDKQTCHLRRSGNSMSVEWELLSASNEPSVEILQPTILSHQNFSVDEMRMGCSFKNRRCSSF